MFVMSKVTSSVSKDCVGARLEVMALKFYLRVSSSIFDTILWTGPWIVGYKMERKK